MPGSFSTVGRGANHPQTLGKIEHYDHVRYHESRETVTLVKAHLGKAASCLIMVVAEPRT